MENKPQGSSGVGNRRPEAAPSGEVEGGCGLGWTCWEGQVLCSG